MKKISKEEKSNEQLVLPKVSVVVPVYNVEKYLQQCLDSILAQTFQDFELILVNDGSDDKSGEICEKYAKHEKRIRVFHQKNQGQSTARNIGVSLSRTDWILFVDSDDVIHSRLIEYLYKAALEVGANASTCMRKQDKYISKDFFEECAYECYKVDINEDTLIDFYNQKSHIYWALFPSLIKKDIVEKKRFIPQKIYEDNALTCQWLYEAKRIAVVSQELYFYRQNPTGTMQRPFSPQKLDYLWALREQLRFYDSVHYYKLIDIIAREYIGATLWMCQIIDKESKDKKLKKEVSKITKRECEYYKQYICGYIEEIQALDKQIHPYWTKVKKRVKRNRSK